LDEGTARRPAAPGVAILERRGARGVSRLGRRETRGRAAGTIGRRLAGADAALLLGNDGLDARREILAADASTGRRQRRASAATARDIGPARALRFLEGVGAGARAGADF